MSRYLIFGIFILTLLQGKLAVGSDSLNQPCRPDDFGENQSLNQALEHIYQVRMGYIELSQVDPDRDDQKKAFVEQSGLEESAFEELLERFGGDFYTAADELLYHLNYQALNAFFRARKPFQFLRVEKIPRQNRLIQNRPSYQIFGEMPGKQKVPENSLFVLPIYDSLDVDGREFLYYLQQMNQLGQRNNTSRTRAAVRIWTNLETRHTSHLGAILAIPERLTALDQTPATAIKPSHYLAINHLLARIKPRFVSEIYFGIVDDRVLVFDLLALPPTPESINHARDLVDFDTWTLDFIKWDYQKSWTVDRSLDGIRLSLDKLKALKKQLAHDFVVLDSILGVVTTAISEDPTRSREDRLLDFMKKLSLSRNIPVPDRIFKERTKVLALSRQDLTSSQSLVSEDFIETISAYLFNTNFLKTREHLKAYVYATDLAHYLVSLGIEACENTLISIGKESSPMVGSTDKPAFNRQPFLRHKESYITLEPREIAKYRWILTETHHQDQLPSSLTKALRTLDIVQRQTQVLDDDRMEQLLLGLWAVRRK